MTMHLRLLGQPQARGVAGRSGRAIRLPFVLALLCAACGTTRNWTESTLALEVDGIAMNGDSLTKAKWVGTGFWIDDQLLATNAHVATRGHRIVGVHDDKSKYHFDTIVALDREADIAILRADRKGDKPGVGFIARPSDPKDLRGRATMMVGNSGGIGLGFFEGRVTNVLGEPGSELVLHDTRVVGGSSGSAIYDKEDGKVMGIHHSGLPGLDSKAASAAWRIQKVLNEARKRKGIPLENLFTIPNIGRFAAIWGQREFCIQPGQLFKVSFDVPRATDILGFVKPRDRAAILETGLIMGGGGGQKSVVWSSKFKGEVYLPFSLQASGPYELVVAVPATTAGPQCGIIGAGEVQWEKGIE